MRFPCEGQYRQNIGVSTFLSPLMEVGRSCSRRKIHFPHCLSKEQRLAPPEQHFHFQLRRRLHVPDPWLSGWIE